MCEEESLKIKCGELIDKEIGGSEDSELEDQLDTPGIPQADIEKDDEEDVSQNIGNYIDNGTEARSSTRNMMQIRHTSSASVRFGISDGATAAIASGFLRDLIEAGHLPPSMSYLALDRSKVSRGKEAVTRVAKEKGDEDTDSKTITAVFFDGRKDKTKVLELNSETNRYHQKTIIENHISLTLESDGQYQFYFTPEPSDHKNKPAKMVALGVYN